LEEARRKEVFCFYKLQVEIPKTFFTKLGDSKAVTPETIDSIANFIKTQWPVLAKKKRVTYRVSYDAVNQVINAVPLGKEAPLSSCCMRNVIFVF